MRIEATERIHAGIEQQAGIVAVGQEAIDELPAEFAEFLLALGVPEQVLAILAHRNVGVHAAAIDSYHRLRQE